MVNALPGPAVTSAAADIANEIATAVHLEGQERTELSAALSRTLGAFAEEILKQSYRRPGITTQ